MPPSGTVLSYCICNADQKEYPQSLPGRSKIERTFGFLLPSVRVTNILTCISNAPQPAEGNKEFDVPFHEFNIINLSLVRWSLAIKSQNLMELNDVMQERLAELGKKKESK